jgi:sigma-E factor negative regulatory protein RseB
MWSMARAEVTKLVSVAALLCAVSGCVTAAYGADDDARAWLARTDQALATRNYQGVFVHEHAGHSETLRVIHRVVGDVVSERLLCMDGSGREFIRRGTELTTYLPDRRLVLVEKSPDTSLLLSGLPRVDAATASQYEVRMLERTRVAGRDAVLIAVVPMDALRYGYRLWIDEATGMPLKTQLRDERGNVLEQIIFTDLRLPAHIADSLLEPAVDARNYRWVRRDHDIDVASRRSRITWQAGALPPGFRMTASATQVLPGATSAVEHLVFSDGMASVSVFVEPQSGVVAHDDAARLGSSSAYSTVVEGYRVTAVGEVPLDTVRTIAQAVHASDAEAGGSGLLFSKAGRPARGFGSEFGAPTGFGLGPLGSGEGAAASAGSPDTGPRAGPGSGAPYGGTSALGFGAAPGFGGLGGAPGGSGASGRPGR